MADNMLPLESLRPQVRAIAKRDVETSKSERQEFFLPVSGFIWFFPEEVAIIDHPAFQRLGKINQLGQAFIVYRGATHKRFEHVLGVVGVVEKMIAAVQATAEKGQILSQISSAPKLSPEEHRFIRLSALLHDIGHLAAGHTIEDELGLVGKHDADKRLTTIFAKISWEGGKAEPLENLINQLFKRYLPSSLVSKGMTATDVVRLLVRKIPKREEDEFFDKHAFLEKSADIRLDICRNMVGNTVCADLLDYIYRDWYHIGKTRSFDDRIFQYMELRRQHNGIDPSSEDGATYNTKRSSDDRFVIALGREEKVRTDGVSSILGLLEWRYELAEAVLFHRTKIAAGAMLDRALFELWGQETEDQLVGKLLELSDEQLLDIASDDASINEISSILLNKLRQRKIFSLLTSFDVRGSKGLIDDQAELVERFYSGSSGNAASAARNRALTARHLELDFEFPEGSIAIYCSEVRAKLADVTVAIDNQVVTFRRYEDQARTKNRLSGGHLAAQIRRFEGLYKIHFFIDEDLLTLEEPRKLDKLKNAIKTVVLGAERGEAMAAIVKRFAKEECHDAMIAQKHGVSFIEDSIFAKSDPGKTDRARYPNGADCIRNFIERKPDG